MATNPDVFAPDVQPQEQAPNDTIHVQTNPGQFGALIGQGLGQLGVGVTKAGDFWGQVQTDHQLNSAYPQAEQIVSDFKKLQGADATNAQAQTKQQLEDVFAKAGAGLTSAQQKLQFDNTSRAYLDRFLSPQIDNHADQQGQSVAINTFTDGYKRGVGQVAVVADNPALVDDQLTHVTNYGMNIAHARYGQADLPLEVQDQVIAKAKQDVYGAQIAAIEVKNPALAQKLLDARKDDLGEMYAPLAERISARADQSTATQAVQRAEQNLSQGYLGSGPGPGAQPIPNASGGDTPNNNFGNIRKIGVNASPSEVGFESYPTPQAGVQAVVDNLQAYQDKHGINTLSGIYNRWAPESDHNDTPLMISRAAQWTGIDPNQPIDTHDPATLEKLVTAQIRNEHEGILPADPNLIHAVTQGYGAASSGGAPLPSAAIKSGMIDQLLQDPALKDNPRAFQEAVRQATERASAVSIAAMQNKQAQEERAQVAGNEIVTDMQNGKMDGLVGRIANNPDLDWRTKVFLSQLAESKMHRETGKDTQTYGPTFWDAYQRIQAPQGDPRRITDPSQLYAMGPSGDLTVAGIDKLTRELQEKSKSPEGEAEAAMKKTFLTGARAEITGSNAHMGLVDPKGDEQFNKFQGYFWPEYERQRAAGVPAVELLNPSSPKYLGGRDGQAIEQFKRPWDVAMKDLNMGATATPGPSDVDLASKDGIVSAYKAGKINYQQGFDAMKKLGIADASAPNDAPPIVH